MAQIPVRHEHAPGRPLDPARFGPPPPGVRFRCDTPAGFFPLINACKTPWRLVPAGAQR